MRHEVEGWTKKGAVKLWHTVLCGTLRCQDVRLFVVQTFQIRNIDLLEVLLIVHLIKS